MYYLHISNAGRVELYPYPHLSARSNYKIHITIKYTFTIKILIQCHKQTQRRDYVNWNILEYFDGTSQIHNISIKFFASFHSRRLIAVVRSNHKQLMICLGSKPPQSGTKICGAELKGLSEMVDKTARPNVDRRKLRYLVTTSRCPEKVFRRRQHQI